MANTYKNIVITPNIGNTADPKVQFSGGNTTANTDINLFVYPTSNGTISFEGSAGQLFSITNDLTGSIFSVNDVSGIPSIDVYANGFVYFAPYGGSVQLAGTSSTIVGDSTIRLGFSVTSYNLGTGSGTVTINPRNGNYQYITNNGAFTLAAPATDCAIDLLVLNGATAGSITFSGFQVGSATGSTLTTTNGNEFIISIRRINSLSTYSIYALQ